MNKTENEVVKVMTKGMARVALDHKRKQPAVDSRGFAMKRAQGLANGYSEKALERMASGYSTTLIAVGIGCAGCEGHGRHVWPCDGK